MKRKLLMETLMVAMAALPLWASAEEPDCFPACTNGDQVKSRKAAPVDENFDVVTVVAARDTNTEGLPASACKADFVKRVEDLDGQTRPIRDIVGYVRSPQGLAIKLVNDHIVRIPVWVGYAMDPIGSIKHRAVDEIRTMAKDSLSESSPCANESAYPAIDLYAGHTV